MKKVKYIIMLSSMLVVSMISYVAHAHHSFPAQYDANRIETVEGLVTNVEWRNPHVYFYMDVFDDEGNVEEWSFELSNISAMRNRGWSNDTLKAGDLLTVTGARARDNSFLLNASKINRTDTSEELL